LSAETLEPYIFFSDIRYTRNLIFKDPEFEVVLLCWKPGQYSAIHGHENQKCWMRVEKGELEFCEYQEEPAGIGTILKPISTEIGKKGFVDGPAVIHKVANISHYDAISLHLYAKPFDACDIYDLSMNEKKRLSLGYNSIHGKIVATEK
jgi:cysteine dioxygenase